MLFLSSLIMALAWLGHLRFKELSFGLATLFAWLLVFPEYLLNIGAIRLGYRFYTGGQMAAFRLCSGVICVALVARYVLKEDADVTTTVWICSHGGCHVVDCNA